MAVTTVLTVSLTDHKGDASSLTVYFPPTATQADIETWVANEMPVLDELTGAKIEGVTVALAISLPGGLKAAAIADDDNQEGANLSFDADNTVYAHGQRIPAIRATLVSPTGIDISATEFTDWEDAMVTGNGTAVPSDRFGNTLLDLQSGNVTFRKR